MAENEPLILDTCALLWLAAGNKKLSRSALQMIDKSRAVYVSAISGFEIAIKVRKGKLELPLSVEDWFDQTAKHHDLTVLPITLDICIASASLPPVHEDPCDRFIIAASKLRGLTVVTTDERFEAYGVHIIA